MSSIVEAIKRTHKWADENSWPIVYWAVDIHGTVLRPTYDPHTIPLEFYPNAEECLQYIDNDDNNILIMNTSSWPEAIADYKEFFLRHDIEFRYANVNPEVETKLDGHGYYLEKFYFNIMLEDKAGFEPEADWYDILQYMKERNG